MPEDLELENIWLLNERHCMRSQVLNICRTTQENRLQGLTYNTGSVETLIKMVDLNNGATIIPELGPCRTQQLSNWAKSGHFKTPEPVREISLVTHKNFIKKRMLNAFKEEIMEVVPKTMKQQEEKRRYRDLIRLLLWIKLLSCFLRKLRTWLTLNRNPSVEAP